MLPALTFPAPAERALFWGKKQSKYRPEPRVPEKGWEPGILQFSSCWDVSLIGDTWLNPCPCLGSWHLWGQNAWWLIGCRYGTEVPVVKGKKKVKNRTCCQHFVGSGVACLTQSVAEKVFFVRGQESEAKASGGCRVQPWGTELLHLHPPSLYRGAGGDLAVGPCYCCTSGESLLQLPRKFMLISYCLGVFTVFFSSYTYVWSEQWRLLSPFPCVLKAIWDAVASTQLSLWKGTASPSSGVLFVL